MKTSTKWRTDERYTKLVEKRSTQRMIRQHICTNNDVNGNPRRLYCVYDVTGMTVCVWEEGYGNIPDDMASLSSIMEISVMPSEYNAIRKQAKADGIYCDN